MTVCLTAATLRAIAGGSPNPSNMQSVLAGLDLAGERLGLTGAHRLAQYVCQITHESGRFRYDQEIWGPTAAQRRYDTRTDLGNTPARDGDGYRYRGRGPIQITGKDNYRRFTAWAKGHAPLAPDFVVGPDEVTTDPWEGLVGLWYWSEGNPTGNSLNRFADIGDTEMITRLINGGLNGFDDRLDLYVRTALVFLGEELAAGVVERFQARHGLIVDDIAGPATRKALHLALVNLEPDVNSQPAVPEPAEDAPDAPATVVEPQPAPIPAPPEIEPPVPASASAPETSVSNGWLAAFLAIISEMFNGGRPK